MRNRKQMSLLMEGWRKFLNEGEQDLDPEYREYDYESQSQQDWERNHPYVDPDDDTTLPGDEPFNKPLEVGTRVDIVNLQGVRSEVNGEEEEYDENDMSSLNLDDSWRVQVSPSDRLMASGEIIGYDAGTNTYSVKHEDESSGWPVLTHCILGEDPQDSSINIIPEMSDEEYEKFDEKTRDLYDARRAIDNPSDNDLGLGPYVPHEDEDEEEDETRYKELSPAEKKKFHDWARSRAQGMKFKK